jgi:hypothetical protein
MKNCSLEKALRTAYASNLDYLFDNKTFTNPPSIWIHGHIHSSNDYYINNTRIISNPRGYLLAGVAENSAFKDTFIIDV